MPCGLYEVDKGSIIYDNRNFVDMNFNSRKGIRREIGMLFQGGALFDSTNRGRKCDVPS